jgi:selenocysteine lyase/cysteine desulfurase
VKFLESTGIHFIENKISHLAEKTTLAFEDRCLLDDVVVGRKNHSSIFNLSLGSNLIEKITSENIIFSTRGKGIRVSFNFYNEVSDLEKLLDVIDHYAP